jgi:hypothetical protein
LCVARGKDSELFFDYGDWYWGDGRPVEAGDAEGAPSKRRRVAAGATGGPARASAGDACWEVRLAKLKDYKAEHGDCMVPRDWAADPALGRWVNMQRRLKRKLDRGEPSVGMTAERAAKLEALGFVFELSAEVINKLKSSAATDDAGWEGWLAKLKAYRRKHGDCNVPQGWAEDPRLGRWVDKQRTKKRKLDRGEPSEGMTVARAAKLKALGFAF